jgi:hypothetical protein
VDDDDPMWLPASDGYWLDVEDLELPLEEDE